MPQSQHSDPAAGLLGQEEGIEARGSGELVAALPRGIGARWRSGRDQRDDGEQRRESPFRHACYIGRKAVILKIFWIPVTESRARRLVGGIRCEEIVSGVCKARHTHSCMFRVARASSGSFRESYRSARWLQNARRDIQR